MIEARLKIEIGYKTGLLTVSERTDKRVCGYTVWRCRCDCGNETVVGQTLLQSGKMKSCGCLISDQVLENLGVADGSSASVIEHYQTHLSPRNTSGHNDVYLNKRTRKWTAQITFRKKTYYLGSFLKLEDAIAARKRGEEMYDEFLEWYYGLFPDKKTSQE